MSARPAFHPSADATGLRTTTPSHITATEMIDDLLQAPVEQADLQATAAELEEIVGQGLALIKRTEFSALEFLQTIRDESGLLTGVGVDEFGFMHLGFQEYLAAVSTPSGCHGLPSSKLRS